MHSWKKIGLFVWSAVLGCLSCALFLGFALEVVFGQLYEGIVTGIFINNFIFTMALGFPVLIVLTSSDFGLGAWVTLQLRKSGPLRMTGLVSNKWALAICIMDTAVMGIAFFLSRRAGFTGNPLLMIMGVLSMACIIVTCLMQGREANV